MEYVKSINPEEWNLQITSYNNLWEKPPGTFSASSFWGYYLDNQLIAYVMILSVSQEINEILFLTTRNDYRRQGYMKNLLKTYLVEAKINEVNLEVRYNNFAAQKLYEFLGFKKVGSRSSYYANGEDAILYSWFKNSQFKV